MDKAIFVQNVKKYCAQKGVKPTIACRESGAGVNLLSQLEKRGTIPSVERVQQLAQYLGVTTSELLGEVLPSAGEIELTSAELAVVHAFRSADDATRQVVTRVLDLPPIQAGTSEATA